MEKAWRFVNCGIEESMSRQASFLREKLTFNLKLKDNALDSIYGCELKNSNGPMFICLMCPVSRRCSCLHSTRNIVYQNQEISNSRVER